MSKKYRDWVFTWNNYTEEVVQYLENLDCKYIVFGYEVAPTTGTPHLQGYVYFANPIVHKTAIKRLMNCGFVERSKSDYPKEARAYALKLPPKWGPPNEKFFEKGTCPHQGKRTDIDSIKELARNGASDLEIFENSSNLQAYKIGMIGKSLHAKKRSAKTVVYWYYGPTGTGKTRKAYENFPDAYFKDDTKWWDGYDNQESVIIDDFRVGQFNFAYLLRLLDRYPMRVETKGSSREFNSKNIIITCPYHPQHYYVNEDVQQLLRRIDHIEEFQ